MTGAERVVAAFVLRVLLLAAALISLLGCTPPATNRVNLPPPVESTTIGPGDVIEMNVVGEDKLPTTYTVAPDGTVDFPYVHRQTVSGLEPQQVVDLVRAKLIEGGFLTDPSVVIAVKEYRSKVVNVLGQVNKPGTFPLVPGITLVQAISQAGGPNSIADLNNITLTRATGDKRRTLRLSLNAITEGRSADIPLQAGDVISIGERVF